MPDALSPAQSGLPLITNSPLVGRENTAPVQPEAPAASGQPNDGENLSLSTSARSQITYSGSTDNVARGIVEAGINGLEKAGRALQGIKGLWQQDTPSPESIQPYAMQVIEAASTQYQGTSPLDTDGTMNVGEQKVPGFKLVGENTNSLIEFSALMAEPESLNHLAVAQDNVVWALGQFQDTIKSLDQSKINDLNKDLVSRGVDGRPELPGSISIRVHTQLDPRRVASLLA